MKPQVRREPTEKRRMLEIIKHSIKRECFEERNKKSTEWNLKSESTEKGDAQTNKISSKAWTYSEEDRHNQKNETKNETIVKCESVEERRWKSKGSSKAWWNLKNWLRYSIEWKKHQARAAKRKYIEERSYMLRRTRACIEEKSKSKIIKRMKPQVASIN